MSGSNGDEIDQGPTAMEMAFANAKPSRNEVKGKSKRRAVNDPVSTKVEDLAAPPEEETIDEASADPFVTSSPAPERRSREEQNTGASVFDVLVPGFMISMLITLLLSNDTFDYKQSRGSNHWRFWTEAGLVRIGRRNEQGEFIVKLSDSESKLIVELLKQAEPGCNQSVGNLRVEGFEHGALITKTVQARSSRQQRSRDGKTSKPKGKTTVPAPQTEQKKDESAPAGTPAIEDLIEAEAVEASAPRPRAQITESARIAWMQTIVRFCDEEVDPKGHLLGVPFSKSFIKDGEVQEIEAKPFGMILEGNWNEEAIVTKMVEVYSGEHPMASAMALKDQYDNDRKIGVYWLRPEHGSNCIIGRKVGDQYFLLPITEDMYFGGKVLDDWRLRKAADHLQRNAGESDARSGNNEEQTAPRRDRLDEDAQAQLWKTWLKTRKGSFKMALGNETIHEFRARVRAKAQDKCRVEFDHGCYADPGAELVLEVKDGVVIACCKRAAVGYRRAIEDAAGERLAKAAKDGGDWTEALTNNFDGTDIVGLWPLELCNNDQAEVNKRGDTFLHLPRTERCALTQQHGQFSHMLISLEESNVEDTIVWPLSQFASDQLINRKIVEVGKTYCVGDLVVTLRRNDRDGKAYLRDLLRLNAKEQRVEYSAPRRNSCGGSTGRPKRKRTDDERREDQLKEKKRKAAKIESDKEARKKRKGDADGTGRIDGDRPK